LPHTDSILLQYTTRCAGLYDRPAAAKFRRHAAWASSNSAVRNLLSTTGFGDGGGSRTASIGSAAFRRVSSCPAIAAAVVGAAVVGVLLTCVRVVEVLDDPQPLVTAA
jgi:hypothetical protein